ncbi:MAG: tetratricopeptide repeat protein [Nitrospira sp.]|nr:tetratricopeptide repeat protein [Nitrospira sp.]
MYIQKGLYDQALIDLDTAITLDPDFADAYSNRVFTYYSKAEYYKAWEDMIKAESLGFDVPSEIIKSLQEKLFKKMAES